VGATNGVTYVGHATVLIELDGARLLTDPLLRRRVTHLRRESEPDIDNLADLDAVLISHAHHDHLHLRSLRLVARSIRIVVPKGMGGLVERQGFQSVVEVSEEDSLTVGSVSIRATRAVHAGKRQPGWRSGPALGYVIEGSQSIYFAGDTDLFDEMDGLVEDLDVALLPIWGWGPSLGRGMHLDPRSAAEALRLLQPRIAVPIHWGTYRPLHLSARSKFLSDPAEAFVNEASELAPEVQVEVLRPGDRLQL